MVGIGLQDWPCIETALGKCNLTIQSSIHRFNRATQPGHITPISASVFSCNEWISADIKCFHPKIFAMWRKICEVFSHSGEGKNEILPKYL